MAFWNRQKTPTNEARDYLRATDAVSRPMAILLSLLTIVIVAALVFTLFWGVKWSYDRIRGNDTVVVTITPDSSNSTDGFGNTATVEDNPQEFPGFLTDEEVRQASGQDSSSTNSGQSTNQNTTPAPTTTPVRIPNTGPDEE